MTVDKRYLQLDFDPSGMLPWQLLIAGFSGFYPQNWVRIAFDRWRHMTRSANAVLDAVN